MNENWCAFFIATQYNVTPEQAFQFYEKGKLGRNNTSIDPNEVIEMKKLKSEGNSYKEIGQLYGISSNAVYRRIKYYEKKTTRVQEN